jgi:hypothetical protein
MSVTISNVNLSTPSAAPGSAAAPAEAAPAIIAAPVANKKLTITSAREATIVDTRGRILKVRRLSALDKVRLFKATGSTLSENRVVGSYYATAAACISIDDMPVAFPTSEMQLDALVGRLDEDGLESVLVALIALAAGADTSDAAKNS